MCLPHAPAFLGEGQKRSMPGVSVERTAPEHIPYKTEKTTMERNVSQDDQQNRSTDEPAALKIATLETPTRSARSPAIDRPKNEDALSMDAV